MKFSLAFKFVLMIALPLVVGLAYVAGLNESLNYLDDLQGLQTKIAEITLVRDRATATFSQRPLLMGIAMATQNPSYQGKLMENSRELIEAISDLNRLCSDDPEMMEALNAAFARPGVMGGMSRGGGGNMGELIGHMRSGGMGMGMMSRMGAMGGMGMMGGSMGMGGPSTMGDIRAMGEQGSLAGMAAMLRHMHGTDMGGLEPGRSDGSELEKSGSELHQHARQHKPNQIRVTEMLGGPLGMRFIRAYFKIYLKKRFGAAFTKEDDRLNLIESGASQKESEIAWKLAAGLLVEALICGVLIWRLRHSISTRLRAVMDNIATTAQRGTNFRELFGSDEIDTLNQTIVNSARLIQRAEQERSQTSKLMAEELEAPLQSISSVLETLKQTGFVELSDKGDKRLTNAVVETRRLQALVQELTSIDTSSEVKFDLTIAPFELAELAQSATSSLQELAKSKGITISTSWTNVTVAGDPGRVMQVAMNLLSNAIKFAPTNSTIQVETTIDNDTGTFSVTDEGSGIAEEFKSRIFNRFQQADKSAAGGSGLGLAISKQFMEAQNGELNFRSPVENGKGSVFWLSLPVSQKEVISAQHASLESNETSHAKPTKIEPLRSLWAKAALINTIPLIIYAVMTAILCFNLFAIYENISTLSKSRKLANVHSQLINSLFFSWTNSIVFSETKDASARKDAVQEQQNMLSLESELDKLSQDANNKQKAEELKNSINENVKSQNELMDSKEEGADEWFSSEQPKNIISLLSQIEKPLIDKITRETETIKTKSAEQRELRRQKDFALLVSFILIVLIFCAFVVLVVNRWTKRIKPILANVESLAKGDSLNYMLLGKDELAQIDFALHDAAARIEELKKFKAEMIAVTSHELRTPLTSLAALIELIQSGMYGKLTSAGSSSLLLASNLITELIFTITNLLDLEKMHSGKTLVQLEQISAADIIAKVMKNAERLAADRKVIIECNHVPPAMVLGDEQRLVQALSGLVCHYIDIVPEHSKIKLDFEVGVSAKFTVKTPNQESNSFGMLQLHHFARQNLVEDLARAITEQLGGTFSILQSMSDVGPQSCHVLSLARAS